MSVQPTYGGEPAPERDVPGWVEPGWDEPARNDTAYPDVHGAPGPGEERAFVDPGHRRAATYEPALPPSSTVTEVLEPPVRRRRRGGRGPTDVEPRPGYIPGLDGLRAIAIVAVLVFHYLPGVLPGGYLGVDVFFVVSGFLITTLLLRELDRHGRVDLPAFWKRRARRLLPALALVVLVSVTAARLVGGDLLVGIGRQTLGAMTFTTNWLEIAAGASYFHSTSPILFVNFWSLAVEEQFYLLWPLSLVVALALTRTTRQRVVAVAAIGLASTVAMAVLFTPGADATRVYYGTDTHLMGLMAGAAFALAWADPTHRAGLRSRVWRRWRWAAVLGSLAVLGALMRWMGESSPWTFRGGILLASLATLVLLAALLESRSPWRWVMELAPLRWVGARSYGIYLWHWPVLVVAGAVVPYALGTTRGWIVLGTALLITLVLSELSLRLVETPVRRHGFRASLAALGRWLATPWQVSRIPRIAAGLVGVMVLLTAVALVTAPEKSRTQLQIEQNEARIAGAAAGSAGSGEAATGAAATEAAGDAARSGTRLGAAADGAVEQGSASATAGASLGLGETAGTTDGKGKSGAKDGKDGTGTKDGKDRAKDKPEKAPPGSVRVNGSTFVPDDDGLLVPAGDQLTAIGDSLVVTSADGLTYRFPGINYVARSNRQWGDSGPVIEQALAEGSVRDNVVLHLGTNAGVDEDALRAALDAFGPKRNVVVMNLYVTASFTASSNETIAEVVADYPHAVVGDWHGTISKRPQDLQSDKVHPDMDGMHVYAAVVARAFDELAERGR